jgi:hypothetical protein
MINKLKNIKRIKKIFTPGLFLWLALMVVYAVGLSLLSPALRGELPLWKLMTGEAILYFTGVAAAVLSHPLRGKKVTVAPNDSVKDLLDRIVAGYAKGPYTVIELSYDSFELRDAVCRKLSQEVFNKVYQDACNEIGETYLPFNLSERAIDCAPQSNSVDNVGIKNIQVNSK